MTCDLCLEEETAKRAELEKLGYSTCYSCGFEFYNSVFCPKCGLLTTSPVYHHGIRCKECGNSLSFNTEQEAAEINAYEPDDMEFQDADSGNVCVICGHSLPFE